MGEYHLWQCHNGVAPPSRCCRVGSTKSAATNKKTAVFQPFQLHAGLTPAAGLVDRLVEIYGAMRAQYPESGSVPAYDASLRQFVRAGLGFAVTQPRVTGSDGMGYQSFEASFLEPDLPKSSRITDKAIRNVFYRWRARIKSEIALI